MLGSKLSMFWIANTLDTPIFRSSEQLALVLYFSVTFNDSNNIRFLIKHIHFDLPGKNLTLSDDDNFQFINN